MAALGTGAPFALNLAALGAASAQTANDYKALVCIFLYGGNDNHNTVIPYDAGVICRIPSRRAAASPGAHNTLLPLTPVTNLGDANSRCRPSCSRSPRCSTPAVLRSLPTSGLCCVQRPVRNIRIVQCRCRRSCFRITINSRCGRRRCPKVRMYGWGGRIGDVLASANAKSTFTSISISGNAVWASGQTTQQYQVGPGGAVTVNSLANASLFGSATASQLLRRLVTEQRTHVLENDHTRLIQRGLTANQDLRDAMAGMPALQTVFPDGGLAAQLKMAARLIAARNGVGAKRQVIFVSMGGFDNHAFLSGSHPPLLTQLAAAISAFDAALGELNVRNQVTTFTASDFGRTLASNGDGSDHGWGCAPLCSWRRSEGARYLWAVPGRRHSAPMTMPGRDASFQLHRSISTRRVSRAGWDCPTRSWQTCCPTCNIFRRPRCRYLFDVAAATA